MVTRCIVNKKRGGHKFLISPIRRTGAVAVLVIHECCAIDDELQSERWPDAIEPNMRVDTFGNKKIFVKKNVTSLSDIKFGDYLPNNVSLELVLYHTVNMKKERSRQILNYLEFTLLPTQHISFNQM